MRRYFMPAAPVVVLISGSLFNAVNADVPIQGAMSAFDAVDGAYSAAPAC